MCIRDRAAPTSGGSLAPRLRSVSYGWSGRGRVGRVIGVARVIASTPTETADPGEQTRGPVSHQGVVDDVSPAAGRGHVLRPAPRHSGAADGRRQSRPGRSPPAKSALAPSVRAAGTVAAARTAVAREAVGTLAIDSARSACSGGISGETTLSLI